MLKKSAINDHRKLNDYGNSFVLSKGKIKVWIVNKNSELNPNDYLEILSQEENNRAQKFVFEKDRSNFILSRGILRILLANYTKTKPHAISFEYGPYGKPRITTNKSIKFNLSHSGELIVFAFSKSTEIGIDVEKVDQTIDYLEIAKTVFTVEEMDILSSVPTKDLTPLFYEFWTRKEAFVKYTGHGLSFPVKLNAISILSDKLEIIKNRDKLTAEITNDQGWNLKSFNPVEGYKAALALPDGTNTSISYSYWPINPRNNDLSLKEGFFKREFPPINQ